MTVRTPEDLVSLYEAEQSEREGIKAREELLGLLTQPGWSRLQTWLSGRRDTAFQQLRGVQGTSQVVAESFWKWQAIDALYEDIEAFIKTSIDFGEDILRRERSLLEEQYLRQEIFNGRTDQPGSGSSGDSASNAAGSNPDSY